MLDMFRAIHVLEGLKVIMTFVFEVGLGYV